MTKNILFLVTGMTPQIITETVWALACDPKNNEKWIPDEVLILSTQDGLTQIKSRLFADGIFNQFQIDYPQLSNIQFSDQELHVITNSENFISQEVIDSDVILPFSNNCLKLRKFNMKPSEFTEVNELEYFMVNGEKLNLEEDSSTRDNPRKTLYKIELKNEKQFLIKT